MKYEDLVKECEVWRHTLAALCGIDVREMSPEVAVEAITEKEKSKTATIRELRGENTELRRKCRRTEDDSLDKELRTGRALIDLRKEFNDRIDEIRKQLGFDQDV